MAETKINLVPMGNNAACASDPPTYFYQRFSSAGECLNPGWPRISDEDTVRAFQPRGKGLHLLLINPPIREWSYPNIMPIGQGYMGSVR